MTTAIVPRSSAAEPFPYTLEQLIAAKPVVYWPYEKKRLPHPAYTLAPLEGLDAATTAWRQGLHDWRTKWLKRKSFFDNKETFRLALEDGTPVLVQWYDSEVYVALDSGLNWEETRKVWNAAGQCAREACRAPLHRRYGLRAWRYQDQNVLCYCFRCGRLLQENQRPDVVVLIGKLEELSEPPATNDEDGGWTRWFDCNTCGHTFATGGEDMAWCPYCTQGVDPDGN